MHHTSRRTLSALAGQIIGYRRDGRPIRLAAGGSGEGGDGAGSGSGSGDGGGAGGDASTGGDDQGAEGSQGGNTGKTPEIKGEFDPERHARALASAREAEKKAKDKAKAADERVAAILKAAGLTPDGKEDPAEQLKAARESADKATARARQTAVELAVYKSAGKAGADPDAVLDSRGFLASVADLDPDSKEFADQVIDAMKKAVKANPKLAGTAPAGRQGLDHSGGTGTRTKTRNLDSAVARKLGG
ncbi:hypothetical protein ACQSSU_12815 [Micromonospora echinospora]